MIRNPHKVIENRHCGWQEEDSGWPAAWRLMRVLEIRGGLDLRKEAGTTDNRCQLRLQNLD